MQPIETSFIHQITPSIYQGRHEARNYINAKGILSVVEIGTHQELLSYHSAYPLAPHLNILTVKIEDTVDTQISDYFYSVAEFIEQSPKPLLIHCNAGLSRSVTLLIAYFMIVERRNPEEVFQMINAARPTPCRPNPGFTEQLRQLADTMMEM